MHLRLDVYDGPKEHAQTYMSNMGITYQYAVPQSIADCWWFFNCENVPTPLPKWLSELKVKPHEAIGYGLYKEMADAIESRAKHD